MDVRVRVDTKEVRRRLKAIDRQAPFAIATALTQLAKDGQEAAQHRIETAFDRPIAFTQRAVGITPARKSTLFSRVFIKDIQAGYLTIQETGGERRPKTGAPVIVPVQIRVNAAGNIPRGAIKRIVAKPDTIVAKPGGRLPPGIYQRPKRTKRGATKPLKMLVAFEKVARYEPRFRFYGTVERAVRAKATVRFTEAIDRAIATAK